MVTAPNQSPALPQKSEELLLITRPSLRTQLLKARLFNEVSATCIIQRGDQVYLSLRGITDETQRKEVTWAVMRLQMGAKVQPQTLPEPLKTVLLSSSIRPSPLLQSLIWGGLTGIIGGVLVMALVGLAMTILNPQTESYAGIAATAVSFLLSGTLIGCSVSVYSWRRYGKQTACPREDVEAVS